MDPAGRYHQQIGKPENSKKTDSFNLPKKSQKQGKDFEVLNSKKNENIITRGFQKVANATQNIYKITVKPLGDVFKSFLMQKSKNTENFNQPSIQKLDLKFSKQEYDEINRLNTGNKIVPLNQKASHIEKFSVQKLNINHKKESSPLNSPSLPQPRQEKAESKSSSANFYPSQEEHTYEGLGSAYFKTMDNIVNLAKESLAPEDEILTDISQHNIVVQNDDFEGRNIPPPPSYLPPLPPNHEEFKDLLKTQLPSLTESQAEIFIKLKNYIPDDKVIKLCNHPLMKDRKDELMNTLKSIVDHFESKQEIEKDTIPKKDNAFGWSIRIGKNAQPQIYIRTPTLLGEGGFKKVTSCFCLNNMKDYVSISPKKNAIGEYTKETLEAVENEGDRIEELHQKGIPDIVPRMKVSYRSPVKGNANLEKVTFIAKKSPSSGFDILEKNTDRDGNYLFDAGVVLPIMKDVLNALKGMHAINYSHNDVKPDNLLLKPQQGAYLADFDGLDKGKNNVLGPHTRDFLPPEVQTFKTNKCGANNDCYATGIMFMQYLFGDSNVFNVFFYNEELKKKYLDHYTLIAFDNHVKQSYPGESSDDVMSDPKRANEIKNWYDQTFLKNLNDGMNLEIGKYFYTAKHVDNLIKDLKIEMVDRNLFEGDEAKQNLALQVLQGLLHPDPKKRMTAEQAHALIEQLMK